MNRETNDVIEISDLEVFYHVGVHDEERAKPQKLLLTLRIYSSFDKPAVSDSIVDTIDYQRIVDGLKIFGVNKQWRLIEKLAVDIADWILREFKPNAVEVVVKKFIIPETKYISVTTRKSRLQN